MRTVFVIAGVCLLTGIAAGAAQPRTERRPAWNAPPSADGRRNPFASDAEKTAGGKKVYLQRCAVCHGTDLTGARRGPNLATRQVQGQSDGALFWKISSGNTRTGMPGFSFLPEAQRWQLVSYLRAAAE